MDYFVCLSNSLLQARALRIVPHDLLRRTYPLFRILQPKFRVIRFHCSLRLVDEHI